MAAELLLRPANYWSRAVSLGGESLEKQPKVYVAPKLQALGRIESITNAISCTGFANKMGTDWDDASMNSPLVGTVQCF